MSWGKWIIASFIGFALFIGALVTVCVRQDISLVSKDYYGEELAYQEQIDRMKNAAELTARPKIEVVEAGRLQVAFDRFSSITEGELVLFSSSNPAHDRTISLSGSNGIVQQFDVTSMGRGKYRAKMHWTMEGKGYYIEEVIVL